MVILFNNSLDTQFLNYLRRHDNSRFLKIKDKIKERCIPQVQFLLNRKISNIKDITNFEVKIPEKGNQKRELDYFVLDFSTFFPLSFPFAVSISFRCCLIFDSRYNTENFRFLHCFFKVFSRVLPSVPAKPVYQPGLISGKLHHSHAVPAAQLYARTYDLRGFLRGFDSPHPFLSRTLLDMADSIM